MCSIVSLSEQSCRSEHQRTQQVRVLIGLGCGQSKQWRGRDQLCMNLTTVVAVVGKIGNAILELVYAVMFWTTAAVC
jgi:hypothetical protein